MFNSFVTYPLPSWAVLVLAGSMIHQSSDLIRFFIPVTAAIGEIRYRPKTRNVQVEKL